MFSKIRKIATVIDSANNAEDYDLSSYIMEAVKHIEKNAYIPYGSDYWMLISPTVLTYIQAKKDYDYEREGEEVYNRFVGTLTITTDNNTKYKFKMFIDSYADDKEDIVVGYKGPGETDAGLIYCPHDLLTSSGVVMTSQHKMLMNFENNSETYEAENVSDYYVRISSPIINDWLSV